METGERTTRGSTGAREGRHWERQAHCLSERSKNPLKKEAQVIKSKGQ